MQKQFTEAHKTKTIILKENILDAINNKRYLMAHNLIMATINTHNCGGRRREEHGLIEAAHKDRVLFFALDTFYRWYLNKFKA